MDERTREYMNLTQSINDETGRLGYKNGCDWAENAGVLGASDAGSYVSAHYLRNAIAHGRAKDVRITQETLDFVNAVLLTIQATSQASNASKYRVSFLQKLFGKKEDDLPAAQKELDVDERTREFLDVMQLINEEARGLGYKNGRKWAENAGVLGVSDVSNYVSTHYLRNATVHGRSMDVHVSQETLDFVKAVLMIIQEVSQTSDASKPRVSLVQKLFNKNKTDLPAAEPAEVPREPEPEPKQGTLEWYLQNAEQGDASAQLELGRRYISGEGVAEDKAEALKWYSKAAEQGNADAQYRLAGHYAKCSDMKIALKYYRMAAEQAHADAQLALAEHYYKEFRYLDVDDAEKEEAQKWFLKAAALGNTDVLSGMCFLCAEYKKGNWEEVRKWSLKAAEQGNADAQRGLGLLYRDRDPQEEGKWLLLAAKQGHEDAQIALCVKKTGVDVPEDRDLEKIYIVQAEKGDPHEMYCLGRYYLEGLSGIPKNLTKAEEWLTKAAERGHPDAQYAIGNFYRVEDEKEAQKWYLKAAEQGHTQAQIDLAQLYCEGDMYDEKESQKWLIKAAKQGDRTALDLLADDETDEDALDGDDTLEERYIAEAKTGAPGAMYELGYNYLYGCGGVRKNLKKAVEWLTVAAARGDGDAMYELGCCYENGWGVDQDEDEARRWYWEAFVQGNDEAEMRLKELREED